MVRAADASTPPVHRATIADAYRMNRLICENLTERGFDVAANASCPLGPVDDKAIPLLDHAVSVTHNQLEFRSADFDAEIPGIHGMRLKEVFRSMTPAGRKCAAQF